MIGHKSENWEATQLSFVYHRSKVSAIEPPRPGGIALSPDQILPLAVNLVIRQTAAGQVSPWNITLVLQNCGEISDQHPFNRDSVRC